MTDLQALALYATRRDADAFRLLVEQYQQLVYAAASRRLARREDVEDVVQQTFLQLAKNAGDLRRNVPMWLYTTAINAANDLIRRDQSRRRREALAADHEAVVPDAGRAELDALCANVDDALARLPDAERALLVEHFFAGRSQRGLATATGVSQPTVARRIKAAVDALRERLIEGGYTAVALPLADGLARVPQADVPAAMTSKLMSIGMAGVSAKSTATAGVGMAFIGVVGAAALAVGAAMLFLTPRPAAPPVATAPPSTVAPPATAPAAATDWRSAFERAYALGPNENLKFIPLPKQDRTQRQAAEVLLQRAAAGKVDARNQLPLRDRYQLETSRSIVPISYISWRWKDGRLKRQIASMAGRTSVVDLVADCTGLDPMHVDAFASPPIDANGDWVVRDGATAEVIVFDLVTILRDQFKMNVRFDTREISKDALVVSGPYRLRRIDGTTGGLQIYSDILDRPSDGAAGGGSAMPARFWQILESEVGLPIVDESTGEPERVGWAMSRSVKRGLSEPGRQQILDNITAQTGVRFTREPRTFTQWTCIPTEGQPAATRP